MDGRSLIAVAAAEGGGVRIWDSATGARTADLNPGKNTDSLRLIRATGGRTFLVALDFSGVEIYDPASGQPIAAVSLPNSVEVHVLEDGFALWKLFIRTGSRTLLWRPALRGKGFGRRLVEAGGFPRGDMRLGSGATAVVRRASGHALVAVATGRGIRLWDPVSGLIARPPFGDTEEIRLVAVARPEDDDLLLVENGPRDRHLQLWDPFTGVQVAQVPGEGHGAVALPGGRGFARIESSRIVVWSLDGDRERSFDVGDTTVDALAVLGDGAARRIVSAGPQGVRVWDLYHGAEDEADGRRAGRTRYRAPRSSRRHDMWPLCRVRDPRENADSGLDILVLGRREGLDIHDAATGKLQRRLDIGDVLAVQPLPSAPGTALVAVTGRNSWSIWDLASEQPVRTMHGWPLDESASCIALTPAGLPVFVIVEGGLLRCVLWDPDAGKMVVSTVDAHQRVRERRSLVALPPRSQGDRVVVAAVSSNDIGLIDVTSGDLIGVASDLQIPGPYLEPQCLCTFTAQGRVLLAASTSAGIRVWDTSERWGWGKPLAIWASPGTLALTDLVLPDGRTLLASGAAGGVRLWDPWTGDLRHTLLTGAPVHALAAGTAPTGTVLHIYGPAGLATVSVDERLL
jgi:WD40 repeat protein